ncbi:MAG: hypothetical protein H7039_18335 [Bryobacteraceae bacterium]|nr:hypothetical protein [Bryobacteraceae bacterium]
MSNTPTNLRTLWSRIPFGFVWLAVVGLMVAGISVTVVQPDKTQKQTKPLTPVTLSSGEQIARPVYALSVVSGGVYTQAEAKRAVERDWVVKQHYKGVAVNRLTPVSLRQPALQYVSYRKNNQIYWTRNRVALPAGELILTDGVSKVRARCGNRLADLPQSPTVPDAKLEPTDAALSTQLVTSDQDRSSSLLADATGSQRGSGRSAADDLAGSNAAPGRQQGRAPATSAGGLSGYSSGSGGGGMPSPGPGQGSPIAEPLLLLPLLPEPAPWLMPGLVSALVLPAQTGVPFTQGLSGAAGQVSAPAQPLTAAGLIIGESGNIGGSTGGNTAGNPGSSVLTTGLATGGSGVRSVVAIVTSRPTPVTVPGNTPGGGGVASGLQLPPTSPGGTQTPEEPAPGEIPEYIFPFIPLPRPVETPEPGTFVSMLLGVGIAGLASHIRNRHRSPKN